MPDDPSTPSMPDLPLSALTGTPSNPEEDAAEANILDAAQRVFLRQGTDGARMQEIADEAGVNKSMLHYYFRSKERLAEAVFMRAVRETYRRFEPAMQANGPFREFVHALVAADLAMMDEHPYLVGYILSELHHHPERWQQAIRLEFPVGREAMQARLDAAIDGGEIRPVSLLAFTTFVVSMTFFPTVGGGLVRAYVGASKAEWEAYLAERETLIVDLCLHGLQPTGSAPGA
ncbi:MAG: TetR/AcrR family transcriptional regulator [Bacteroidota bacterium]